MAEIVGAVASGLSIAQIGGQMLTIALKLRNLLDDIRDAPASLGFLLDQVEVLAPILDQMNIDESNEGNIRVQVSVDDALRSASRRCRDAAEGLSLLCSDLSTLIESTRGLKHQLKMTKIAIKKELLEKYERRLYQAVQTLSLAQQNYIMYVFPYVTYKKENNNEKPKITSTTPTCYDRFPDHQPSSSF